MTNLGVKWLKIRSQESQIHGSLNLQRPVSPQRRMKGRSFLPYCTPQEGRWEVRHPCGKPSSLVQASSRPAGAETLAWHWHGTRHKLSETNPVAPTAPGRTPGCPYQRYQRILIAPAAKDVSASLWVASPRTSSMSKVVACQASTLGTPLPPLNTESRTQ